MKLKTFSVNDVRMLRPCYDPVTGLDRDGNVVHPGGIVSEDWTGTALDVLKIDTCPPEDRLWLVLREGWIDDRTLRLFAVWCARKALRLADEHDPRSVAACDVAERFALGGATSQELAAARGAAWAAAEDAAGFAAWVARIAAWATAWAAAETAAEDAADAADLTARIAAEAAAEDADRATWAAAWSAARESQIKRLIAMLETDDRKS